MGCPAPGTWAGTLRASVWASLTALASCSAASLRVDGDMTALLKDGDPAFVRGIALAVDRRPGSGQSGNYGSGDIGFVKAGSMTCEVGIISRSCGVWEPCELRCCHAHFAQANGLLVSPSGPSPEVAPRRVAKAG